MKLAVDSSALSKRYIQEIGGGREYGASDRIYRSTGCPKEKHILLPGLTKAPENVLDFDSHFYIIDRIRKIKSFFTGVLRIVN